MYETINEPVEVLVSFDKDKILPMFFKWRQQRYRVERVNLIHSQRNGEGKIYYFNVSDQTNYFKLSFSTQTLRWQLDELYTDG